MEQYSADSEIVIGLVTPVGVNFDDISSRLEDFFKQFNYNVNWLHLSKIIEDEFKEKYSDLPEEDRLPAAMSFGNDLRKDSNRADIFALFAIRAILQQRTLAQGNRTPDPLGRTAHIIRSIKHPDEVETLRASYGSGFVLLGITASEETKLFYLQHHQGIEPEDKAKSLIERDDRENDLTDKYGSYGQSTRDVFQLSDAFLSLDNTQEFQKQLLRIFEVLFSKPVVPPTLMEYSMFMAYAASLKSADLSRQVGAVIVNRHGDMISTGANDVPKAGGGQYWPCDDDQRDYKQGFDCNEKEKDTIVLGIIKSLDKYNDELSEEENIKLAKSKLKNTGLLDITEYGRAVHAEMDALMSATRNGTSVRDAILYTTTFPCHNCAKHIIAAGVKEVIFIEPYPKSFATKLHGDAIQLGSGSSSSEKKVIFKQFEGIGPRKFIDLFSMKLGNGRKLKRKEKGQLKGWIKRDANLRLPMIPLSYLEREVILAEELNEVLSQFNGEANEK